MTIASENNNNAQMSQALRMQEIMGGKPQKTSPMYAFIFCRLFSNSIKLLISWCKCVSSAIFDLV